MKPTTEIRFPCGEQITPQNSFLRHLRSCTHGGCQAKIQAWDKAKAETAAPIKAILSKRKLAKC